MQKLELRNKNGSPAEGHPARIFHGKIQTAAGSALRYNATLEESTD